MTVIKYTYPARNLVVVALLVSLCFQTPTRAGVTIITHGLNGNVDGWVTGMADRITQHSAFPGTNFSCYLMNFTPSGGGYLLAATRVAGSPATSPESGEIIIKLDWRQLADGNSYDTYQVASTIAPALLNTNFIPELAGHAIAEFPLHLIGHSRGGSLVCELSRLLGMNGIWVDQVTTLDPHPLNDPAFPFDWLLYDAQDAPAYTYENVLFHDNYWQNISSFVYGKSVPGAYVRKLTNLNGGYGGSAGAHSDVHLWYHGTIDSRVPATDTEASITSAERPTWWSGYETTGAVAGFHYSLIGRGNRLSTDQPVGVGTAAIRDGYNQWWDLGAGTTNNRTALTANNGNWPNLITFNRTTTNLVEQGQTLPVKFYYQWAQPSSSLATISIYLDADLNPLNTNQTFLQQITVPGNGAGFVSFAITNLTLLPSNAAPGRYAALAAISGGDRTRHHYAPEFVEVIPVRQPPTLEIAKLNSTQYRIAVNGLPGQTVVIQGSTDLQTWTPLVTNTLTASRWDYTNSPSANSDASYFRGVIP